jgi:hypothetical protein
MRCRRAAEDRTLSHSGKLSFCILLPKVVTLSVGVGDVSLADAEHLLQQSLIAKDCATQLGPILPLAATDHIIDGGKRKFLVIQMAVQHGWTNKIFPIFLINKTRRNPVLQNEHQS